MSPSKPVLIVGSGISGLALAQALKRHGIPFRIYERDSSLNQRAQGYRIRINQYGLDALRKCLPAELYKRFEETTAENLPMGGGRPTPTSGAGPGGPSTAPSPRGPPATPGPGGRPRGPPPFSLPADRSVMRSVLVSGLEDSVFYGKAFRNYTVSPHGVIAHFADGTSSPEGSLVVGADGIYSGVARELTNDLLHPKKLGSWMIFGKTFITPELKQRLGPAMTGGMKLTTKLSDNGLDGQPVLFTDPILFRHANAPPNYIFWVVLGDESNLGLTNEQFENFGSQAVAEATIRLAKSWLSDIKPLIEQQDPEHTAALRMTTSETSGVPYWATSERVTLIGDAVHCMPPTGGSGANTALRDAALLSDKLKETGTVESNGWSKETVADYEREMRDYAGEWVSMSYEAATLRFGAKPIDS